MHQRMRSGCRSAPASVPGPAAEVLEGLRRAAASALDLDASRLPDEGSLIHFGLDSLSAAELAGAIESALGVEVPIASLLEGPSLLELAEQVAGLADRRPARPAGAPCGLAAGAAAEGMGGAAAGRFALSWGQRAIWLLDRLAPGNPAYILAGAARTGPDLDVAALRAAVAALVARHGALRTTFELDGEEPVQVAHPAAGAAAGFEVVHEDAAAWSAAELEARMVEEAHRPFDLARGPLLRLAVWRRRDGHVLVLAVHHIVADFWSLGVLLAELGALLGGRPLPPPPAGADSYAGHVRREAERLRGERGERLRAWWSGALPPEAPPLELPADRPRPPLQSFRGDARGLRLDPAAAAAVLAAGAAAGTTPFMTLLAAWLVLLHRLSGQDQLLVGTPTAGRGAPALAGTVGYFVNPVVIRGDLAGDPSFPVLLGRVREAALGAFAHQDYPFALLAERLGARRDASRSPVFQAMFTLYREAREGERGLGGFALGMAGSRLDLGGLKLESVRLPRRAAQLDLTLLMAEVDGGLAASLQFNSDLFDGATAERMLGQLACILAALANGASGANGAGGAAREGGAPGMAGAEGAAGRGFSHGAPISAVPLLSRAESHQLTVEWNDTAAAERPAAAGLSAAAGRIHELFERQAARRPGAAAVAGQGSSLTYGELESRANRLARYLRRLGVGPETRVGLCVGRSPEMVVALLAILKAGGAYLPLDPGHPPERLASMLEDGAAEVLVTEERWLGRLGRLGGAAAAPGPDDGRYVVCLDREAKWIAAEDVAPLGADGPGAGGAGAESLAYLIYTSGSTGRPKGVGLPHRAVVNFLRSMALRPGLGAADAVVALTTLSFDIAGLEIYLPLAVGGRVEMVDRDEGADGRRLAARLAAAGVTAMQATPATWRLLLDAGWKARGPFKALCGGEALPRELAAELLAAGAELWNMYGPTETAVWSATRPVQSGDGGGAGVVGLGRPIANTRLCVVDRRFGPVPLGVAGELWIGGAGVARGYWGRPELTAERFLPDPWSAEPGARLYRTGDLVRRLPDGDLEFLGRIDRQVKVRGHRIELGEIESALLRHPAVGQAVATVHGEGAGRRLLAYLVARGEAPAATPAALRDFVRRSLPEYMVPADYVWLDRLPLGPSGKVDRDSLPAPDRLPPPPAPAVPTAPAATRVPGATPAAGAAAAAGRIAPRTPAEELAAGLWAEVLRLDAAAVAVDDDFFRLGGHSLLAVRLAGRLRDVLGVELALPRLLQLSRLEDLARELESAGRAGRPPAAPIARLPRPPGTEPGTEWESALSFAQERLWFLDRLDPGSAAYNEARAMRLTGRLEVAALAASLGEIRRRHEVLRTRFAAHPDGRLAALAAAPSAGPLALPVIDLSALPPARGERAAAGLVTGEARRAFDLAAGPLLRAAVLRLAGEAPGPGEDSTGEASAGEPSARKRPAGEPSGAERHVLLLDLHHTVSDGGSLEVLARELSVLYAAGVSGEEPAPGALPALPIQYADFAHWQREWASGPRLAAELDWWREQLGGRRGEPPPLDLPLDRPRPAAPSDRGARRAMRLPAALAGPLSGVAQRHGVTLFMTLLAAFDTLLYRYSGQSDVAVGTPVASRDRPEVQGLVGLFVNTLVLRLDLAGDPTCGELLARVRQTALAAYAHQDVPFDKLAGELAPRRGRAETPFFQVVFALQPAPPTLALPGLAVEYLDPDTGTAKFDLSLAFHRTASGGLAGTWTWRSELFDAATVARIDGHWRNLLTALAGPAEPGAAAPAPEAAEGVAAGSGRRLSELPLLAAAERHQLLSEWNATAALPAAAGDLVHVPIERQAAAQPSAAALVVALPGPGEAGVRRASGWQTLTYGELEARANRLARRLRRLGVGPEQVVGVYGEASCALVAGLLAILKAGGAYLPLDPSLPPERLARMVAESGMGLVLAGERLAGLAERLPAAMRVLPLADGPWAGDVESRPDVGEAGAPGAAGVAGAAGAAGGVGAAGAEGGVGRVGAEGGMGEAEAEAAAGGVGEAGAAGAGARAGRAVSPHPGNAAYVLYTSGSTGTPKGVVVPHRAVVNRLRFQLAADLAPGARVLQRTRLAFDVSVVELFAPLWAGATLVLTEAARRQDPAYLAAVTAEQGVTNLNAPPALLGALLAEEDLRRARSLRRVVTGGDRVPGDLPQRFFATLGTLATFGSQAAADGDGAPRLFSRYGPTEATVSVSEWECLPPGAGAGPPPPLVPLGRPIAGSRFHLLDRHYLAGETGGARPVSQELPVGAAGELCIAGSCLARGYLGRPDLTAAAFIPDPFAALSGETGGRLYRTGDLARRRSDGALEFLGRVDHQVKIRGFRVELGEIEAALAAHPAVEAAAAAAWSAPGGEARLAAFAVPRPPAPPGPAELRAFLQARLPEPMVPAEVLVVAALPLSVHGKLDRRALAALAEAHAGARRNAPADPAATACLGPQEELVAGLWSQLLGVGQVGPADNFFALGGHSLLATQVVSRLRAAVGVELPMRAVFEHPTVAGLAAEVERLLRGAAAAAATAAEGTRAAGTSTAAPVAGVAGDSSGAVVQGGASAAAPPILPVPRQGELPLSFAQQRLWFLDQLQPGSSAYNLPRALRLEGALGWRQVALLRHALAAVVRRHEALRTRFAATPRGPVQEILAAPAAPAAPAACPAWALPLVCLDGLPEGSRRGEALRLAVAEARRSFVLSEAPLLRATLVRLAAGEHLLLTTLHHIVADAWSIGILLREASACYRAFAGAPAAGAPAAGTREGGRLEASAPGLPELPIQYADFACWQRAWLRGEALESQLAYWRGQLAGAPGRLDLPADRPRPAAPSGRGGSVPVRLPGGLSRQVAAWSRSQRVTPFMTLAAAFALLLGRSANQQDVLFGTPIANRNRREIEDLVGFFVNTLVLRIDLGGAPSFGSLVRRVREVALGAYSHQDLPFERVVDLAEDAAPGRDPRRSPLVQAMFVLQTAGGEALDLPGLACSPVELPAQSPKFDLTLELAAEAAAAAGAERAGGFAGSFSYDRDLFDAATVRRHARRLETLLAAALRHPEAPAAELPLLSASERHQLLREWGPGGSADRDARTGAAATTATLAELFEEQVRRAPGAPAVTCEGSGLTYSELNRRANQLAHRLRELGVGADERVGLCAGRTLDLVVGVLGIVKAGGAYVPLDPTYPRERLAFLAADAGVRVAVGTSAAPPAATIAVRLDADAADLARRPGEDLPPVAGSANLAYVIYTSGSTGRPKGVLVTHANVARLFAVTRPIFRFGPDDVWTLFHSYAFDFSVWELWGALLHGGRLVVVPHAVSRTPEAWRELLAAERVTVVNQTPSAFAQLQRADEEAAAPGALAALRLVIFGGEALEPFRLAPWFRRHGDRRPLLVNMYGITETTVHVTWRPLAAADAEAGAGSAIGRALADLSAHVLDGALEPAPIGVAGELFIGGAGLARGYLGRPGLTASRFVPDPFAGAPVGARLYRTGDLARVLPDGSLDYLGRLDHQVKIRGFRIEPQEIQAALAADPRVREALVIAAPPVAHRDTPGWPPAREEEGGARRLVAFVVPRPGAEPAVHELRDRLGAALPDYMVPAAFVLLAVLPLTAHGKVDRRALLELAAVRREESRDYQPPRDDAEGALVEIWEQVLGLDRVGIDDRFFSIGGDSILSLRLRGLAAERGFHFTLPQLFEHQTVRELARRLGSPEQDLAAPPAPFALLSPADRAALPAGLEDAFPLTELQTGMLFHSAWSAESTLYHNVSSYRLAGVFDEEALRAAVDRLLARHPVLRTSFDLGRYSVPLQLVHPRVETPLAVEDLRGLPAAEQERRLAAAFAAERRRKFDVAAAPLLRFHAHRLAAEVFQLTWAEHHAILDGWSVASMMAELFELYRRQRRADLPEMPDMPPPPAAAFRDFVALERSAIAGEAGREARQFWARRLAGAPRPRLPAGLPVAPAPVPASSPAPAASADISDAPATPSVRDLVVEVGTDRTRALRRLAASSGVALRSVLLAVHLRVLATVTGEADQVTGLVVNGRPETRDGERVLGLFLNTLPLRLKIAPGSWLDLVRRTAEAEREILPYRRFPMAEVRRAAGGALFETGFNFTHFHVLRGLEGGEMRPLGGTATADVELPLAADFALDAASSRLTLVLQFDAGRFAPWQVERIAGRYTAALDAMIVCPEGRHEEAPLTTPAERQQLLREWNDTGAAAPGLALHELFELQAAARPDAAAVVTRGTVLTYGELRRRAGRLARHLRSLGAGPEERVGLLVERSPETIAALLGILESGAAYVPLDPDAPAGRLAGILKDCGARLLVTRTALLAARGRRALEFASGAAGAAVVDLDALPPDLGPAGTAAPPTGSPGADRLAYVIYTSGSSGAPKGVMVPHGAVVNYVTGVVRSFGLGGADRGLQFAALSFDASVEEIFAMLLAGGSLALRDEEMLGSPRRFLEALGDLRVTMAALPMAYWHELAVAAADPEVRPPAALRLLYVGGERARPELVERWLARGFAGVALWNGYGPTEATVVCANARLQSSARSDRRDRSERVTWRDGPEVPIGRPVANDRVFLLDADLMPVPAGTAGALFAAGAGVARGYQGRPDLTAASFLPDPWSGVPGRRMYRTGDLAAHRADGRLEFRGRDDDQVKIRGFRVEPGEVELALCRHPAVRQAVVAPHEDGRGGAFLAAWVVAGEGERPAPAELRRFLRERLPAYMVPAAFVLLERLPLNANDKIDRAALPAPAPGREEPGGGHVAPRDPLELRLAGIWEELLDRRPIGVRDDFFELGGHSLLAVQLVARLQAAFGRGLPTAAVLRHPTVEALAALLREGGAPARRGALVEITASTARTERTERAERAERTALAEMTEPTEMPPGRGPRPLVCVHPIGGDVLCYAHLARRLAGVRAVHGLQVPDRDGAAPWATIEEMARHYVGCLRAAQPDGPYALAGWSMGGVVAFEMARQLESAGEEVEPLVVIDAAAPRRDGHRRDLGGGARVALFAGDLARLLGVDLAAASIDLARLTAAEALRVLPAEADRLGVPLGLDAAELARRFAVFEANDRLLARYTGGACRVPLTLVKAVGSPGAGAVPAPAPTAVPTPGSAPDLGWSALAKGPIEVLEIAGDHYTLLEEPRVGLLAAHLRERLGS